MFRNWKQVMEKRGFNVDTDKIKLMVDNKKRGKNVPMGRDPCVVCDSAVGSSFILCTVCDRWCYNSCFGLRSRNRVVDFQCPACVRSSKGEVMKETIEVDGGVIGEVKEF